MAAPVHHDPERSLEIADAAIEQVLLAFPFVAGYTGSSHLSRRQPDPLIGFRPRCFGADLQIVPGQAADGLGRELAEIEGAPFELRSGKYGMGIELRQPSAAELHVHVDGEWLRHSLRRIEVDDRRLQPHRHQRMSPRGSLHPVFPVGAGEDRRGKERGVHVMHELRHRLVVDVDAGQLAAVVILERREGPPFMHDEAVVSFGPSR